MPIPIDALLLEIVVFIGMSVISLLGKFSPVSIIYSFLYYEFIRIVCIVKKGRREKSFWSQYILAVIAMLPYIALIEFMSVLLMNFNQAI